MADYELIGLNEAAPDLRAPTAADTGVVSNLTVTGVLTSSSGEVVGAGTSPETTPLNQYLGGMAFQSPESVVIKPQAVAIPNGIGDMVFQATSDSVIELEYKGSDAVVRTAQIPLSNERLAMLSRVTPLRQAVRVAMTAAASGSNGIQVLDNVQVNPDITSGFTLHWEGVYKEAATRFITKIASAVNGGFQFSESSGLLRFTLANGGTAIGVNSTVSAGLVVGTAYKLTMVYTGPLASGTAAFYVNGVQIGPAVSTSALGYTASANSMWLCGRNDLRHASDTTNAILYNRALSAAEVLSLSVNGPARVDMGGSQVPRKTFDFSAGTDGLTAVAGTIAGNIDGIGGVDNTCRLTATTTNSTRFVLSGIPSVMGGRTRTQIRVFRPSANIGATGVQLWAITGDSISTTAIQIPADTWTSIDVSIVGTGNQSDWALYFTNAAGSTSGFSSGDIFYIESGGTITQQGITGQWNAEDAQSNTGQIFDRSGNGNHALLPATGATIIPEPSSDIQVRGKLTWTASSTAQDVVGINQAVIPANGVWQPTFMIRSSGSITVNIGDGSSATRYGSAVVLAAGVNIVTPTTRAHDGTNRRLVVTPTGSSTATINVLAKYDIVEAV